MSLNWPATIALLASVSVKPRLIVPHVSIRDIRQLDFAALRKAGYDSAVFDKDNCLTLPLQDALIPDLADAWAACKSAFGPGRVLVVSNSAGTPDDPGGIQAESVAHKLGAPVLPHRTKKPGWACVRDVQRHLHLGGQPSKNRSKTPTNEERSGKTVVIGDRLFTDVVLAHRLASSSSLSASSSPSSPSSSSTLAVLVEPWDARDARLLRLAEAGWLRLARRVAGLPDVEVGVGIRALRGWEEEARRFVRPWSPPPAPPDTRPLLRREMGASEWEGK